MSEKPSLSIRKASQIARISCSLTRLVLKNDLGLKTYKKPDLHEFLGIKKTPDITIILCMSCVIDGQAY
jgi:hypothetical protein